MMAYWKWLRAETRGQFRARRRRWRWLGRAPPVRTQRGKNADTLLHRKYYPRTAPATCQMAIYSAFGSRQREVGHFRPNFRHPKCPMKP